MSERVAEIVALEGYADVNREARSAQRWAAAKLIWEELQNKSFAALSEEIKAAGGKGSIGHLTCMKRCWQVVVVQHGLEPASYEDLPFFGTVYNSDEVRRPADRQRRKSRTRDGHDRGTKERNAKPCLHDSGRAWIASAAAAIDTLAEHRVAWQFLTGADIELLEALPGKIDTILDLLKPSKASA